MWTVPKRSFCFALHLGKTDKGTVWLLFSRRLPCGREDRTLGYKDE